ncbi:DUF551 domain-containing protein [Atlantibacter hermannii]|uniref:DUF551 domain-containing protein n=1 Tax=Atlantibacter hermannii TaxID=565 RepID=UPI0028AD1459|nr:DUF551 domain-containing protein [Atlantibacter hermannii]
MNHEFDTKALELSRQAIALFFEPMPGVQLQAKIQNLFIDAMEFAAPAVQDGQPVSQPYTLSEWIPCSERMPDTMISVLVTGDWFHHGVSFWDGASWCDLDFEPPVTHWMPLPAAPQQEAE